MYFKTHPLLSVLSLVRLVEFHKFLSVRRIQTAFTPLTLLVTIDTSTYKIFNLLLTVDENILVMFESVEETTCCMYVNDSLIRLELNMQSYDSWDGHIIYLNIIANYHFPFGWLCPRCRHRTASPFTGFSPAPYGEVSCYARPFGGLFNNANWRHY